MIYLENINKNLETITSQLSFIILLMEIFLSTQDIPTEVKNVILKDLESLEGKE